jgi:hypothetical protein
MKIRNTEIQGDGEARNGGPEDGIRWKTWFQHRLVKTSYTD